MKLVNVQAEKLINAKAALNYVENVKDSARLAVMSFGHFLPVIINEKTGRILNPIWSQAMIDAKFTDIPCLLVEIPAGTEMLVSMVLNGGVEGWLYNRPTDVTVIVPKLRQAMETNRAALLALGGDADYWNDFFYFLEHEKPVSAPANHPGMLDPDELHSMDFDIPRLDLALQPESIPDEIHAWNAQARRSRSRTKVYTAYHFYVEDFRFSALAKRPEQLIEVGAQVAVEPNFSTHEQQPLAEAIHDIYRKRKIARQWQDAGITTIVDMNVTRRYLKLNLVGVPAGWRVYANRAYTADLKHLHEAYEIARQHSGGDDITYLVYGGPGSRELCKKQGWHWLDAGVTIDGAGYGTGN